MAAHLAVVLDTDARCDHGVARTRVRRDRTADLVEFAQIAVFSSSPRETLMLLQRAASA